MAAISGIAAASRLARSTPGSGGGNTLLYAVGAAVIGGTSLFGGRGRVRDAVLGGLVIAIIANGLGLLRRRGVPELHHHRCGAAAGRERRRARPAPGEGSPRWPLPPGGADRRAVGAPPRGVVHDVDGAPPAVPDDAACALRSQGGPMIQVRLAVAGDVPVLAGASAVPRSRRRRPERTPRPSGGVDPARRPCSRPVGRRVATNDGDQVVGFATTRRRIPECSNSRTSSSTRTRCAPRWPGS